MPAAAESDVGLSMPPSSHMTNRNASAKVRTLGNDAPRAKTYNRRMARRGIPKGSVNWFLREWMDTLEVNQATMIERTGWSKATASQLYNGKQDYSPAVVNAAAVALSVKPHELLMPPADAMAIRRLRQTALDIVGDTQPQSNILRITPR